MAVAPVPHLAGPAGPCSYECMSQRLVLGGAGWCDRMSCGGTERGHGAQLAVLDTGPSPRAAAWSGLELQWPTRHAHIHSHQPPYRRACRGVTHVQICRLPWVCYSTHRQASWGEGGQVEAFPAERAIRENTRSCPLAWRTTNVQSFVNDVGTGHPDSLRLNTDTRPVDMKGSARLVRHR